MMKYFHLGKPVILLLVFLTNSTFVFSQHNEKTEIRAIEKLKNWKDPLLQWHHMAQYKTDSVKVSNDNDSLYIFFSSGLSNYPFREESCDLFVKALKETLGRKFRKYDIKAVTNSYSVYELVPNYYRRSTHVDSSRLPRINMNRQLLVKKISINNPAFGLAGKAIALWHSHGYYFEMNLDRWEWQRARLFGTVEDIAVFGYINPYVTRMLENAGAGVFQPRERDTQLNEVIVDNDRSTGDSEIILHINDSTQRINSGFMMTDTLFPGYNPFKHGTSLRILNDSVVYIPDIPQKGNYAVYVSYPAMIDNSTEVRYRVSHTGGKTEYIVNQTIGGETWIYLGTFLFDRGKNINTGSVTVKSLSVNGKFIALDAIRFGGGIGNVARRPSSAIIRNQKSINENITLKPSGDSSVNSGSEWKLSGQPRFLEAARYYLQYAGMPDSLVYSPTIYKNDYNDDYQSRGLWVNYLAGDPYNTKNSQKGLGIPIDLSVAFHTDAGITAGDSVIGTLAIYSTGDTRKFPDGTSRMASRDLSDIIQTEVVNDIRNLYDSEWTRRALWDKPYSEAKRPVVPAVLLELLSHQNLADQRFGLDPRFRFNVSRSVYKGILKYLSYAENRQYIVQPLPVTHLAITPVSGKKIRLSWTPEADKTEPTSVPDKYVVYRRSGDNGFDNGFVVNRTWAEIELDSYDTIYSFKVTALNDGGESFDSEILSTGIRERDENKVLVVNGFDRISGPEWFDNGNMAGVAWWKDRGVADHNDFSTVGDQYDFDRKSPWLDDDSPGWGASYADNTGKVIHGNSFDFPYLHGKAILASGHSFYSVSDEYFCSDDFPKTALKSVDIILGEEKSTPFFNDSLRSDFKIYTPEFIDRITHLTQSGTNILMSGSYVGSDLLIPHDSSAIKFAESTLHFLLRSGHAVKTGGVYTTDYAMPSFKGSLNFNTDYSGSVYAAEAPDAIEPSGKGAICLFRYFENNSSAAVAYRGSYKTIILGFPFETIINEEQRNKLMYQVLNFFEK